MFGNESVNILSLIGLVLVGVSANLLKLIKKIKFFINFNAAICIYIFFYGLYATFGPIDLYKDGTEILLLRTLKRFTSSICPFEVLSIYINSRWSHFWFNLF